MKNFVIWLSTVFTVAALATESVSLAKILDLPGENGFPDAPEITSSENGAIFTQKSRFNFNKGYDAENGKVELKAVFDKAAFAKTAQRQIYFLFSFAGNRKTLSSLAMVQNPGAEKMQLLYSVTTAEGKNVNCSINYLFKPDTEYTIGTSWGKKGVAIEINGVQVKRINYTGKLFEAEKLIIGFPGYRSAMLMTLKSFVVYGGSTHPLARANSSTSSTPILTLPGVKGFPSAPGVTSSKEGATFLEKGRLTFNTPFNPHFGKVELSATFATKPLDKNEERKIYHLLNFTGKNKTIASLAILQYPNKEKMLLTYTVTTSDGKNIGCNAEYPFAPGVEHHITAACINDKLTLSVNGLTLKTTPWRGTEVVADKLLIGFPGSRQSMPMTLKSLKIF